MGYLFRLGLPVALLLCPLRVLRAQDLVPPRLSHHAVPRTSIRSQPCLSAPAPR